MNTIRSTPIGESRFAGTNRRLGSAARLLLWLGLVALSGCSLMPEVQPDPTRFYVLTATATPAAASASVESPARVLLRPIVVPEFLRGRVMQVRMSENEVKYIDEARWAEPLEAALNRVLRENLLQQPGLHVVARASDSHDFEVLLQVRRCEGISAAGVARLSARIEIYSGDIESKLVAADDFTTDVPGWDGKDFAQLAGKLSVAAATLTERIFTLLPSRKS